MTSMPERRRYRRFTAWLPLRLAAVAGKTEPATVTLLTQNIMGTPQGSVISPLLANIYLHYVFDLWANVWCKKYAHGDMVVVR